MIGEKLPILTKGENVNDGNDRSKVIPTVALLLGFAVGIFAFFFMPVGKEREACCLVAILLFSVHAGWMLCKRNGGE